jgi:hypothetical protein
MDFETTTKLYRCDCYGSGLVIGNELDDKDHPVLHVSFWALGGYKTKLDWKERWRWIWNIIKTGSPWTDQIILNSTAAEELCTDLRRMLDEAKVKKDQRQTI